MKTALRKSSTSPQPPARFSFLLTALLLQAVAGWAASGTWTNLAGGSWADPLNWNNGVIADGTGFNAVFNLDITAPTTVTLDGARTIGNLSFTDAAVPSTNWVLDTGSGGPLTLAISGGTPTITVGAGNATLNAELAGTGALKKAGAGILTLGGAPAGFNPFTDGLTINAGNVQLGAAGQLPDAAALTFAAAANGRLQLQGFNETIGGVQDSGGVNNRILEAAADGLASLPATLTLNVAGVGAYSYGGYVRNGTGAGSVLSITKDGTGTQTFSGNAGAQVIYTGPTTINAGVLEFSGTDSVANNSAITVNSGGSVQFSGGGTRSALISGAGNVIKAGDNTLILSGGNTYAGNTTNTAGTLKLNNVNAVGTGTLVLGGGTVLASAVNLATGNGNNGVTNAVQLAGDCTVANTNNTTLSGVISGAGNLIAAGTVTLTLSGASAYTGRTTISNGILSIATIANGGVNSPIGASTSDAANLVLAGGTLTYSGATASSDRNFTINAVTNGFINVSSAATTLTLTGTSPVNTGFLRKTGAGALTLDPGAGSYQVGALCGEAGVLTLKSGAFTTTGRNPGNNAGSLLGYNIGVGARSGGKLVVDGATVNVTGGYTFKIGAFDNGNLDMLSGTVNAGDFVLGHGGSVIATQSGGDVSVTNVYHYDGGNATNTLTGGTLTARRIYNYTAGTNIFTLILNGGVVKAAPGTVTLMADGGRGGRELDVLLGSVGATIDTSLSDAKIARPLDDLLGQVGTLTKLGAGTLTLSSNNTYTGSTTISNGTLLVNGSISTGAVAVKSGAALGGSGTIAGAVTVEAGGKLQPGLGGTDTSALTVNNTLNLAGTTLLNLNRTNAPNASRLVVASTLTQGGTLTVTNVGDALVAGDSFTLFTLFAAPTGSFSATNAPALAAGLNWWQTIENTTNVVFLVNAAPTNSAIAMGALSGTPATVQIIGGKHAPTGDAGETLTVTSVATPVDGTATTDGTSITYTPTGGYTGTNSFAYVVGDGRGGFATNTITAVVITNGAGYNQISATFNGGGDAVLQYAGIPNFDYALDWTHDLALPITWNPILTNTASTNGLLNFTNTPSGSNDFYRTRYVP